MVDAAIGIAECPTPTKFVDNDEITTGAGTVYRQRVSDPDTHDGLADALAALQDILTQLQSTIDVNVTDASITVEVGNEVEIKNDAANPVPVAGTVSVNEPVSVDGTVDLGAVTLAALESISAIISGTVALDAPTLAALESITAAVTGTVAVSNFPSSVEISNDLGSPIPITGTVTSTGAGLAVSEALNFTNHNLLSAAYAGTTAISGDYEADGIELHFTTAAKRTITLTTEDGTVVRRLVDNTGLDVAIDLGKKYFESGEDLALTITQTASACSVSGKLTIAQGSLALTGDSMIDTSHVLNVRHTSAFYNIRGQRYIATTGYVRNSYNVSGELIALFQNPAGSDRVILFDKAEFGATADTTFSRFGGGTASLIGSPTSRPIGRTDGGASSSVAKVYTAGNLSPQFSISAAGTLRKVATMKAFDGYQLNEIYNSLALQPGQQSYWTVDEQPGGGSGNFNTYIDFEWVEIALSDWNAMVSALTAKTPY